MYAVYTRPSSTADWTLFATTERPVQATMICRSLPMSDPKTGFITYRGIRQFDLEPPDVLGQGQELIELVSERC